MRTLPRWILLPAGLGALLLVLPLASMALRVEWSDFWALITSESSLAALRLSLQTSLTSAAACVLLGVPMALLLARTDGRGMSLLRSLVLIPLVLSLIHISEPTRRTERSRMPSSA